jgi:hypothetical protein
MNATVIEFRVQTQCELCKRPAGPDELSECYECGQKYCGMCHTCECDLRVADLVARIREMQPGLFRRLWLALLNRAA